MKIPVPAKCTKGKNSHDFYLDEHSCAYTLRLRGTTLSGQVLDHQSVQVFNLLRKCTIVPDKYLSGTE